VSLGTTHKLSLIKYIQVVTSCKSIDKSNVDSF
jgi:hypothetical protein